MTQLTPLSYFGLLVVAIIFISVISYLTIRHYKFPQFRIIETTIGDILHYRPQVRLKRVWFNISREIGGIYLIEVHSDRKVEFLSPEDALSYIEEFKKQGKFSIPSNKELCNNQKSIYVE